MAFSSTTRALLLAGMLVAAAGQQVQPCSQPHMKVDFITGKACQATPTGTGAVAKEQRAAKQTAITTEEGHVFINTGGTVVNVTDSLSGAAATQLFEDQDAQLGKLADQTKVVARRADKTVESLLEELIENEVRTKAAIDTQTAALSAQSSQMKDQSKAQLGALAAIAKAAATTETNQGDKDKAAGVPWYPMKASAKLSDLGGDTIRVAFPVGRELIADDHVKIYQCRFNLLDSKGQVTKDSRISAAVHAETPRTFGCVTPAWGAGGKLPTTKEWKTALTAIENERELPAPKGGAVFTWVTNTPSLDWTDSKVTKSATLVRAGKNKKKLFEFAFKVDYPYGADGYKDVRFVLKSNNKEVNDVKVTGAADKAERMLSFSVTSSAKTAKYSVTVAVKSAATGLSTSHDLSINFQLTTGIGKGGTEGLITDEAAAALHRKAGCQDPDKCSEEWTLCYSAKKHGWATSNFWNRCQNKGSLFLVHRRSSNKRVSGGFIHNNFAVRNNYYRGSSNRHFLYRIEPTDAKKATFVTKCCSSYETYAHQNYHMCWGGGHDYCSSVSNMWHHTGHDYKRPGGSWGWNKDREEGNRFFDGSFNHNPQSQGGDDYEVYMAKGV